MQKVLSKSFFSYQSRWMGVFSAKWMGFLQIHWFHGPQKRSPCPLPTQGPGKMIKMYPAPMKGFIWFYSIYIYIFSKI